MSQLTAQNCKLKWLIFQNATCLLSTGTDIWIYTSYLSPLLQVGWTHPSLSSRVGFGGFGPHQPSVRMNRIQDLYKLALLQNKTVLISAVRTAVSSSHIHFKCLKGKKANILHNLWLIKVSVQY